MVTRAVSMNMVGQLPVVKVVNTFPTEVVREAIPVSGATLRPQEGRPSACIGCQIVLFRVVSNIDTCTRKASIEWYWCRCPRSI